MTTDCPRCETCKWWKRYESDTYRLTYGECTNLAISINATACEDGPTFETEEDFGCILHEPREGD